MDEQFLFNKNSSIGNIVEEKQYYKMLCLLIERGEKIEEVSKKFNIPLKDSIRIKEFFDKNKDSLDI